MCAIFLVAYPCLAGGTAQGDDAGQFREVNELRVSGEYEKAIAVLRGVLAEEHPDPVVKRAYCELIFTLLQMGNRAEAEVVAGEGLRRFPNLDADIVLFPQSINELYDAQRKKLFGSVALRTQPVGGTVWIDGASRGDAPVVQQYLSAGNHDLSIKKEGHEDVSLSFAVHPNRQSVIDVTLKPHGEFSKLHRFRPGVDLGYGVVRLDYAGASVPGAEVANGDGDFLFTAGLFVDVGITPRSFLRPALRVVRLGSTTNYRQPSFLPPFTTSAKADIRLDYVSASVALKHFPFRSRGFFVSAGPDLAWLLRARLSPFELEPASQFNLAAMDPSIDIAPNLKSYNFSIAGGLGYEIPTGNNFLFVNLSYSHGLVNTAKDDRSDLGWRTRELKISGGFVY
jgi:hypothetical protein